MAATAEGLLRPTIVHTAMNALAERDNQAAGNLAALKGIMTEFGTMFDVLKDTDKVKELRSHLISLLELEQDVKHHQQAIRLLQQAYQPTMESTDFAKLLAEGIQQIASISKFDPEQSSDCREFDEATGASNKAGDEDEEEDLEGEVAIDKLKCPITLKPVLELKEPVQDSKGYIYEKSGIQAMFEQARKGNPHRWNGSIHCPYQGTRHHITLAELKPSAQVERARKRMKFQALKQSQAQTQADVVLD